MTTLKWIAYWERKENIFLMYIASTDPFYEVDL